MSDILDAYSKWLCDRPERVRTHYDRCYLRHDDCMVVRMAGEIRRVRGDCEVARLRLEAAQEEIAGLRLTDAERAVLRGLRDDYAFRRTESCQRVASVLDGLLARLGGDA